MWLFLLLPWLCLLSNASIDTHLRVATATALKFKCDSIPYRSYFEGTTCYFAIQAEVKHGDENCGLALAGAKMRVDRDRGRVLGLLYLNPSTYHDALSSGQTKNLFCSLEMSYTCEQEELLLPGKCIFRSEKPITWSEASNFCSSKAASGLVIHNDYENEVIAGALAKNESGWLLQSHGNVWSAEDQTIDFWKWSFDGQTAANLKCTNGQQHAVITKSAKRDCSAYGTWKVENSSNFKNIALCIKHAECPLCPAVASPCMNSSPRQNHLWDLKYYYNWGRRLHAFCATPEGCKSMQDNGMKYCNNSGSGPLGGTLSDEGFKRLHEVCYDPEERKHIVKMWFTKKGSSYHHTFEDSNAAKNVYVGYVSIKEGACGFQVPIRKWSSLVSDDIMYAVDLNSTKLHKPEWYKGREQDGGRIHFWLWGGYTRKESRADVAEPDSNCPPNGVWSEWTETGKCPGSCGSCHNTTRKRTCTKECGNCPCVGPTEDVGPCGMTLCPFPKPNCCRPYLKSLNGNTRGFFCGSESVPKTVCQVQAQLDAKEKEVPGTTAISMCFLKENSTEKRNELDRLKVVDDYHCKILCAEALKCAAFQFSQNECTLLGDNIVDVESFCPEFHQEWVKTRGDKNCPDIFKQPQLDAGYIPNPALSKGATHVDISKGYSYNGGRACPPGSISDTIRPNNSRAVQGDCSSFLWDGRMGSWIFIKEMTTAPTYICRNITHYIRAARCFYINPIMFSDTRKCGGIIPEYAGVLPKLNPIIKRDGPIMRYGVLDPCKEGISFVTDYSEGIARDGSRSPSVKSGLKMYVTCIDGTWFYHEVNIDHIYSIGLFSSALADPNVQIVIFLTVSLIYTVFPFMTRLIFRST